MNERDLTLIAVGGAFALLMAFIAHGEAGSDKLQPRYEDADTGTNPSLGMVFDHLDTGDHYFHPNHCVPGQGVIFTAHRYPVFSGGNIDRLVSFGLGVMNKRAPQDDDWRTMPPGEAMW